MHVYVCAYFVCTLVHGVKNCILPSHSHFFVFGCSLPLYIMPPPPPPCVMRYVPIHPTPKFTCIHTYIRTYIRYVQKLHSCLTVKLAYVCMCIHKHTCLYMHTCVVCMYVCMCVCTHVHMWGVCTYIGLKQLDVSNLVIPIDVFNTH